MAEDTEKKWSQTSWGKIIMSWGFWGIIVPIFLAPLAGWLNWDGSLLGKIYAMGFALSMAITIGYKTNLFYTGFLAKVNAKVTAKSDHDKEIAEKKKAELAKLEHPFLQQARKSIGTETICFGLAIIVGLFSFSIANTVASSSYYMQYEHVEFTLYRVRVDDQLVALDEPKEMSVTIRRGSNMEMILDQYRTESVSDSIKAVESEVADLETTTTPSTETSEAGAEDSALPESLEEKQGQSSDLGVTPP
jgi:hypothetical protein